MLKTEQSTLTRAGEELFRYKEHQKSPEPRKSNQKLEGSVVTVSRLTWKGEKRQVLYVLGDGKNGFLSVMESH